MAPQQPEHAGLHGVLVVEQTRHRDAEAPDDVLDQVGVLRDKLVAAEPGTGAGVWP